MFTVLDSNIVSVFRKRSPYKMCIECGCWRGRTWSMDCDCVRMELRIRALSDGFSYQYQQCPVCGRIEHSPDQLRILLDHCRYHLPELAEDLTFVSEDELDAIMETLYVTGDPDFRKNLEDARNTPIGLREAWNRCVYEGPLYNIK